VISEEEFLKNHVLRIRELASKADPFIKHRLLNLATNYERRLSKPPRSPSKLPSVDISQDTQD
jgi:hypothetical protein